MPVTTPPALSDIPAFPALSERAAGTYNANAYACLNHWASTGGPQLEALAGNVFANATEASMSAANAANAKIAAEQAQAAAEEASAATKWVSGATYTEGAVAWSPADFASYRRKTTGAGTTDPSADSTNWAKMGAGGGALNGAQTLTTATTLTASSPAVNMLVMPDFGGYVTLPNATTLTTGGCKYVLDNAAGKTPVGVLDSTGRVLGQILPADSVQFHLVNASTAAGEWRHSGNLDPVWMNNEIKFNMSNHNADLQIASIDATRCLIYFRAVSTSYPVCRVVTWAGAGSAPTVSTEITLRSVSTNLSQALPLDSSRAVLMFGDNNWVVLDTSTPAVGTAAAVTFTAGSPSQFHVLDNQYVVVAGVDGTGLVLRAKCLDCGTSGTTITVGAQVNSAAIGGSSSPGFINTAVGKVSSTVVGYAGYVYNGTNYTYWAFALNRTSGTTLSFSANAGSPASITAADSNQNVSYMYWLTASTALLYYRTSSPANAARYVVLTFAAGSATWGTSIASNVITNYVSQSFTFAASIDRTKFVMAACISNGACNMEAVTVSGATVTVGASTSFSTTNASGSAQPPTIYVTNSGRGVISWKGISWSTSGYDRLRFFTLSGTTFTLGGEGGSSTTGALGAHATGFNVSSLNYTSLDNVFWLYAYSGSGATAINRTVVFSVSASATLDEIATLEGPGTNLYLQDTGNANAIYASIESVLGTVHSVLLLDSKRVKRGNAQWYTASRNMSNGLSDPATRYYGLDVVRYTFGSTNAAVRTIRFAEA